MIRSILLNLPTLIFVICSMLGSGLALNFAEIIAPFRKIKLVFLALTTNFVIIPLLTYTLCRMLELDQHLFAGLIILACCAGAPFLPRLATLAGGTVAFGVGLMILLMVVTVFYAPVVIPLAIPGVAINPWSIALPLICYMLLPLFLGLLIKARRPKLAALIRPWVLKLSGFSLIILGVFALIVGLPSFIRAFGTGVYNATGLFIVGSILLGYLFNDVHGPNKYVLALGAGQRNIMAALLVAATNFPDHNVLTVVLIGSLVGFIILFPAARIFGLVAS